MLETVVFLLAASVVFVSLSRRLGFGSILGYLVAGAVIGPSGLRLVTDIDVIKTIAELGVLMLLFLIGLELRPQRIWLMRRAVLGLGGAQVLVTGAVLAALLHFATGLDVRGAIVLGLGLALSSTAIVLPMLGERDLLGTGSGRDAFSVLLFQDMASVPLVAALPLLGGHATGPIWPPLLKGFAALAVILLGGRYGVRPLFRLVGRFKNQEVFTASALLAVAGAAAIADMAHLPTSLGAFAVGVILAESEFRHELQVDIEPFEGLLLGFFFVSIGMAANLGLALAEPGRIAAAVAVLMVVKIAVAFSLERVRESNIGRCWRFAVTLPQGSEFGFVLFGAALGAKVLGRPVLDRATLVVALSMAVSPLLFALSERFIVPRLAAKRARRIEPIDADPAPVVIAGFGRVGQIVGRVLKTRKIRFKRARRRRRSDRHGSPLRHTGLFRRPDPPRAPARGRAGPSQDFGRNVGGPETVRGPGGARQGRVPAPEDLRPRPQPPSRPLADELRARGDRARNLLLRAAPDRIGAAGHRSREGRRAPHRRHFPRTRRGHADTAARYLRRRDPTHPVRAASRAGVGGAVRGRCGGGVTRY